MDEETNRGMLRPEHKNRYGSVEGLPDEELADPDELERMVYIEMWGPVLALPVRRGQRSIRPNVDEDGRVDWGAFATVDFDRYRGEFDKARYKVQKLQERLRDMVIMLRMMSDRIPGRAKYKVMKLVRMGVLDIGDIVDNEVYFLTELHQRVLRLRSQIERLREKGRRGGETDRG